LLWAKQEAVPQFLLPQNSLRQRKVRHDGLPQFLLPQFKNCGKPGSTTD
jgi:hypothetical protein